jgi:hypothetical protein
MSGAMVANLKGRVWVAALVLLGVFLWVSPGKAAAAVCGEEGPGPLIKEAQVTPSSLPFQGGTGAIKTRVESDCGVTVVAEITSTEGTWWSFELLPSEEDLNTNHRVYRGEFQVPENFQEWAVSYSVTIHAYEQEGPSAEASAGEIEVAGVPQFDEPPWIDSPSVSPSLWGGGGGTSKIKVSAGDNRGIANVYAIVTYPKGKEVEVPLEGVSFSSWEGLFNVPYNPTATAQTYSVAVFAEDDIGQTTGGFAGTITVEPKGTPNPGYLVLEPAYLRFGSLPTSGAHKTMRSFVLRNPGKPGSPPVSGVLHTWNPQFFLPGASEEALPYTLAPGEERTFEIGFSPYLTGQQTAQLSLNRSDGRQQNTILSLFGWGVVGG